MTLALIGLGQRAGYSLDDIAILFSPKGADLTVSRGDLRNQAAKLRKQAQELQATADLLDHVADCDAPSHLECPRFQSILKDVLATRAQ